MIWRASTLGLVAIVFGTLGAWIADRDPPTSIYSSDVLTPAVERGGTLRIQYSIYRRRGCSTLVERVLYDSERVRHVLPPIEFRGAPGPSGYDKYTTTVTVPVEVALGQANFRAITTYRCNPVHDMWPITVVTTDADFFVVASPAADAGAAAPDR